MANPTSFQLTNLIAHDDHLEPMIEILQGRIKSQDLAPLKAKGPSSTSYK
jgi:hypothetical protein